jgi:hypothetical protein
MIRLLFGAFSIGIGIHRMTGPGVLIESTTYRPKSKLRKSKVRLKGLRSIATFTWWSFFLLAFSFLGSSAVALLVAFNLEDLIRPWLLRFSILSFEIASPGAFLVSTVVRYALWPEAISQHGRKGSIHYRSFQGIISHNFNVIFVSIEICLLGGLPIVLDHLAIAPLLGVVYVIFSWWMATRWTMESNPTFIYFFLDTTLGWETSISLLALVAVLVAFYVLFSQLGTVLEYLEEGLVPRVIACIGIASCVCRFRD